MPVKKSAAKKRKTSKTVSKVKKSVVQASTVATVSTAASKSNLLILLLVIVSFFAGYLFFKVQTLEQQGRTGAQQNANQQAAASPLSVDNLKKYAKELKLNTNKFNTCLDKDQKKSTVENDIKLGTGLGVQGTPGFFINGRFLGGAFPFEFFKEVIDKEISGQGSSSCSDYSQDLQKYCDEAGKNSFNPVPKTIELSKFQARGAANGKVTVIEFSDFECPFCARAVPTIQQVLKTYPNDVAFYYKQFPLTSIHPNSQKAAEASLCAQEQGKFWEYHDKLFQVQGTTTQ